MRSESKNQPNESWYRSRGTVIVAMIAVILGFFIIREHWEHLTGRWIYLLLLLCPVMHFFGHGGHGGHGKSEGSNEQNS
ncbi:DUF2933 domain-containing protein [Dechloromonas sp. A34]|uniref:DUF2933 domain-containing protein n=1 Tax=Dechloromonas sp. A34 TaxID=447588 RepID=UPI002249448C|nr:DUF2933 domain-containing protein [Dechloromonas sp. A34]